jgi:hypothetical protein
MIIVHVGFDPNPISAPNAQERIVLNTVVGQTFDLYAEAVDSEDPAASFTFAWSVLNLRTGQTASLLNANTATPTLENLSGVWGDIRVFCIATNSATSATSESDPIQAPASAFATLEIESTNQQLTLPAVGSREWYKASDRVSSVLETLNTNGISTATQNNAGELILGLTDGTSLNVGVVRGADGADGAAGADGADGAAGADGADGADGAAGPSQRRFAYTADVLHWYDSAAGSVTTGFNPTKIEVIAGPWVTETAIDLYRLAVSVKDAGALGNSCDFQIFTATPAQWTAGSIVTQTMTATMSATASANVKALATVGATGVQIPAGNLVGVMMHVPTAGQINGLSVTVLAQEA